MRKPHSLDPFYSSFERMHDHAVYAIHHARHGDHANAAHSAFCAARWYGDAMCEYYHIGRPKSLLLKIRIEERKLNEAFDTIYRYSLKE